MRSHRNQRVLRRRVLPTLAVTTISSLAVAACGASASPTASAAAASSADSASSSSAPAAAVAVRAITTAAFGTVLADSSGDALYRFTPDGTGHSVCTGACATAWPPLLVPAGAKITDSAGVTGLSTITRPDGAKQVAILGVPLYTYAGDATGHIEGNGVEHTWFVASVSGGHLLAAAVASSPTRAPATAAALPSSHATEHPETEHPETEHSQPEVESHSSPAKASAPAAPKTTAPKTSASAPSGGGYGY
jgi:predicted lipoprotein with Yx(FWY)xxD motif